MEIRVNRRGGQPGAASDSQLGLPIGEFITLVALLMALSALSIDIMLPALPRIGEVFAVAQANDRQAVVTSYLAGFAAGQLVYGPLSDRLGRKPLLLTGLAIFVCGALAAAAATDYWLLLAARAAQGLGGAGPRVISLAVVRDLFSGRRMARVMSLAMMVFVAIPVFAPLLGQTLLQLGEWRWNFYFLALAGAACMLWAGLRLPETQDAAADGGPPLSLAEAAGAILRSAPTVGYAAATGLLFGCLMAYIGSAQQIFADVFGLADSFPLAFGAVASVIALSSFANASLVMRLGMRRVSHGALAGFILTSLALTLTALAGPPPLLLFCALLSATFFLFALIISNFNAIAMEPMGRVAGMASSLIGFFTTAAGALFGAAVGRLFDGTVLPLAAGFTVLALAALAAVAAVEGWRGMFRGQ